MSFLGLVLALMRPGVSSASVALSHQTLPRSNGKFLAAPFSVIHILEGLEPNDMAESILICWQLANQSGCEPGPIDLPSTSFRPL